MSGNQLKALPADLVNDPDQLRAWVTGIRNQTLLLTLRTTIEHIDEMGLNSVLSEEERIMVRALNRCFRNRIKRDQEARKACAQRG